MHTERAPSRRPRLALISLLIGIAIPILRWSALFLSGFLAGVSAPAPGSQQPSGLEYFIGSVPVLTCGTLLASLAGIWLGIQALRKKEPQPLLAVAGIGINLFFLVRPLVFGLLLLAAWVADLF